MLIVPVIIYLATLRFSHRLRPILGLLYRVFGGIIIFLGGATSLYFAAYTGDQGGIAAFFFQIAVIVVYAVFSLALLIANWLMQNHRSGANKT